MTKATINFIKSLSGSEFEELRNVLLTEETTDCLTFDDELKYIRNKAVIFCASHPNGEGHDACLDLGYELRQLAEYLEDISTDLML